MLKKLRWRFIIAAMTAFGTVMLLLVTGINFLNYSITMKREDGAACRKYSDDIGNALGNRSGSGFYHPLFCGAL